MFREYDEKTLKRVQNTEKDILKKFIEICEKYSLTYFAAYGTLLGTIRHKGFIPWDDDIDVLMPRKDYEKFLEVAQGECGDEFFVQNMKTDSAFHLFFTKLRMNNTKFVESTLQKAESHSGFFIDIIPYDSIPDNDKEMKKQIRKAEILVRLLSANKVREPQVGNRGKAINAIVGFVWIVLHYAMKILHIKGETLWEKCNQVYRQYEESDTKRYTSFFADAEKWILLKKEVEYLEDMVFDDIMVKVPCGYEAILTRCYGDYMQLPPLEQRVNHMPNVIQFPEEQEIRM